MPLHSKWQKISDEPVTIVEVLLTNKEADGDEI